MAREARPIAIAGALVASLVAFGIVVAPHAPLPPLAAGLVTFAGAVVVAIAALAVASRGSLGKCHGIAMASAAVLVLLAFAIVSPKSPWFGVVVDLALATVAFVVGSAIGTRVQHPGHMLPAAVVAAACDLVSVFHPEGPSHAIAASERALSVLAFSFPVPGTRALAPSIGVGDLLFVAIVLGVAKTHALCAPRIAVLAAIGASFAGLASAITGAAVPALPAIGAAVVLGCRELRVLRTRDRSVAVMAMVIAVTGAAALLVTSRLV